MKFTAKTAAVPPRTVDCKMDGVLLAVDIFLYGKKCIVSSELGLIKEDVFVLTVDDNDPMISFRQPSQRV